MNDIFDLLTHNRNISQSTSKMVRKYCEKWQLSGFHALIETHIFEEGTLADLLANHLKMDRVYTIFSNTSGVEARKHIPFSQAREWECFPSMIMEDTGWVEIVIADPTMRDRVDFFRQIFKHGVHFSVGARCDIVRAIDEYYSIEDQLPFLSKDNSKVKT